MSNQDKTDLAQYRAKERGDLIDNCYRARIIPGYVDVPQTTEELRALYNDFITEMQIGRL